jgi:large subunit ribosomal protein L17
MRHHKKGRIFGREIGQRTALLRSLARSLVLKNKIKTTEAKAKELRPYVEKLITKAKVNSVATRRLLGARLASAQTAKLLVEKVAPKYMDRKGGYARITKLPTRLGDSARMAQIELI